VGDYFNLLWPFQNVRTLHIFFSLEPKDKRNYFLNSALAFKMSQVNKGTLSY
jgi:hypothetical protein